MKRANTIMRRKLDILIYLTGNKRADGSVKGFTFSQLLRHCGDARRKESFAAALTEMIQSNTVIDTLIDGKMYYSLSSNSAVVSTLINEIRTEEDIEEPKETSVSQDDLLDSIYNKEM